MLQATHFYHATTKRILGAFGDLFNNVFVAKDNEAATTLENAQRVPINYGPRDKWLTKIEQRPDMDKDKKIAVQVPRMSYEMTSLTPDPDRRLNKLHSIRKTTETGGNFQFVGVPYTMGIQLSILAKSETDALQILEQILPSFSPDYALRIKGLKGDPADLSNVSYTLTGVTPSDEYEGEGTTKRVIIYTLDFEVKYSYYGFTTNQGVIRTVEVDIIDTGKNDGETLVVKVQDGDTPEDFTVSTEIRPLEL